MYETIKQTLLHNPARKWLYLSFVGFLMCFISLGMHVSGSGNISVPLPRKVMAQVFGFTPYYFPEDSPPAKLSLKADTVKFLGNALSYDLVKTQKESLTVSEKLMPANYTPPKAESDISFDTAEGSAQVNKPKDGHVGGSLLTKDKTLITITAPDSVNPDVIESVLRAFSATAKSDPTKP